MNNNEPAEDEIEEELENIMKNNELGGNPKTKDKSTLNFEKDEPNTYKFTSALNLRQESGMGSQSPLQRHNKTPSQVNFGLYNVKENQQSQIRESKERSFGEYRDDFTSMRHHELRLSTQSKEAGAGVFGKNNADDF